MAVFADSLAILALPDKPSSGCREYPWAIPVVCFIFSG
jgi:hypothetical protein